MKSNTIKFIFLILLFIAGVLLSLFYGGSQGSSFGGEQVFDIIFLKIRVPKTVSAILAGATLSAAGLVLQIIFRNPLAGPYVLGISSGASLMVALTMISIGPVNNLSHFIFGKSLVVVSSVIGSLTVTFLILALSKKIRSNVILLLIGLMISQICGALQGALEYFANPNELKSFVIWGMGSLSETNNKDLYIYAPVSILFILLLFFFVKPLNAFLLGENYAINAGINYHQSRWFLILISSVLTGVTTAFCGPIAFVGIAVPLLSRLMFSVSSQLLHLVSCLLIGSIILLFSDVVCHQAIHPGSLPINMVTTFVGAPLVIWLLFKNKQW